MNEFKSKVDLTGKQIGLITVNEYIGKSLWKCTCSCGKEINVKTFNLTEAIKNNKKYACEECSYNLKRDDISGRQINDWFVMEYAGNGMYKCKCKCGAIHNINGKSIKRGDSKSCRKCGGEKMLSSRLKIYGDIGTNVKNIRTEEQIRACSSKEELKSFIGNNFSYKPKALELGLVLGISECMALRKVHKFGLEDLLDINTGSVLESEISQYIQGLIVEENVVYRDRKILKGNELDILLPDRKLAFEINGDYWHSTLVKDRYYHQKKTIECAKKGIHLVHIFEYEWQDESTNRKIKDYIDLLLNKNLKIIHARKTTITKIDNQTAKDFEENYHLQGYASASIAYGCYFNNELIGVMSFANSRFNHNCEYELIRLCWKDHTIVVGGANKMFKKFIKDFNPTSVSTYADITKFTGNSYLKLGFKPPVENVITRPNYVWVKHNHDVISVLTRYETMKQKIIKDRPELEDKTEDEIMEELGYMKIYNSGNIRLEWYAE